MVDVMVGEIRCFAFGITPDGWLPCDGRKLSIRQSHVLFSLIGDRFGGDGITDFALPNLIGRVAIGASTQTGIGQVSLGEETGSDTVTLTEAAMPAHTHTMQYRGHGTGTKTNTADGTSFIGPLIIHDINGQVKGDADSFVQNAKADTTLDPQMIGISGGGKPHENRQPYLKMGYFIATQGIFPT